MDDDAKDVAWKLHREVAVVLGWGAAILLQFAHPLVALGAAEHSQFRARPDGAWRRFWHTVAAIEALTLGPPTAAARAARAIDTLHGGVRGVAREALGGFPPGTPYAARDPALLLWVHATVLVATVRAYERFVGPLTPAERDHYCAQSAHWGHLLGIPLAALPRDWTALDRYVTAMQTEGAIQVTPLARTLAHAVLTGPVPPHVPHWLWPARCPLQLITAGLLPPTLRDAYGLPWSIWHAALFCALCAGVRHLLPLLPARLRYWPAGREGPLVFAAEGEDDG